MFTPEQQRELREHIEGIVKILNVESEDVLNAILLMLEEDSEQHDIADALCDVYYSE